MDLDTEPVTADVIAAEPTLTVAIAGHVDHGKSTVIGRLLADLGALPDGKLDQIRRYCERNAKPFEYAFVLDALKDERAQGITIDSARVFFKTARRSYIFIDTPGHVEFLKNMVTGASRADAAIIVIDAKEGVRDNSRRHGYLLSMLGIRQVIVLVNKMDLVAYDQSVFEAIVSDYSRFLEQVEVEPLRFLPVAARAGDNLARRAATLAWYRGPTVVEALDGLEAAAPAADAPLRLPVQGVYKFTAADDTRRIVAGTVESGTLRVGDALVFQPSGKQTTVASIECFNRSGVARVSAGEATGFTMVEQVYVERGEIATRADQPEPSTTTRLVGNVFWLGGRPLIPGKHYLLKLGTARVGVRLASISRVLDAATLDAASGATEVVRHQAAECTLVLDRPIAFDTLGSSGATSRFVLVDGHDIVGGGIVRDALPALGSAAYAHSRTSAAPVLWLTGLSGSGKSTIATRVCRELDRRGIAVENLDGDAIRAAFPATGFSSAERDAHVRRVAFLASRLAHHRVVVVAALISPYRAARDFARTLCPHFIEVHVATPLAVCEARDVKGLYAKARQGAITGFTGLDDPYEPPAGAELVLDTTHHSVSESVAAVLAELSRRHPDLIPEEIPEEIRA